jgi:hypothetical protein
MGNGTALQKITLVLVQLYSVHEQRLLAEPRRKLARAPHDLVPVRVAYGSVENARETQSQILGAHKKRTARAFAERSADAHEMQNLVPQNVLQPKLVETPAVAAEPTTRRLARYA